ncbi:MAG: tetratricopeptide repeat protein [Ignavibacteriaceae bacterium]|nr:tetratricopeptide repeat protein [Ignavibacteriaceae bacterium]
MLKILCLIFLFGAGSIYCQYLSDDNNRYMQGQNYETAGYPEKAKEIFEDLYKRNPSNLQYFNSLNRIYISLKQYDLSVRILEEKLAIDAQNINLYGLLGSTYYLMGNETRAFSVWEDGIKNASNNPINYKVIAQYAIDRRAFEKAIDFMKRGKKISDNPLLFSSDLANLYFLTMQYKDAAEEYLSIILRSPGQYLLVQNGLLSFTNKPDALQATIEVFEKKRDKDNINLSYILASLYMQSKSYEKAYNVYSEIDIKSKSKGIELFRFAQELYNEHEYDFAAKVFMDIIEKYLSSPIISSAKLGYAKALEENFDNNNNTVSDWKPFAFNKTADPQRVNEIINNFSEIVKIFPNSESAYEALYYIGNLKYNRLNDFEGAKEIFNKLITDAPKSQFTTKSYEELGDIYIQEGNLNKSKEIFQKLIENGSIPESEKNYSRYKEAKISFYEGNFNSGRDLLNNVIISYKDNNSNNALELDLLMNTEANDSSNLVIFANAEYLSEQKKFSQARDQYLIIAQNQKVFVLQNLAKLRVAEMDIAMDNYDSSIKLLQEIADEKEKNIYSDKALYLQGNIFQYAKKDNNKAIEIYENLLARFPNSIYLDDARASINKLKNKIS